MTSTGTSPLKSNGSHDSFRRMKSPRQYFSRKFSSRIDWNDLPLEKDALGMLTPAGIFFLTMRLICPLAYVYIFLIIIREATIGLPAMQSFVSHYLPALYTVVITMQKSSLAVEIWVFIEAFFYIMQKYHFRHLQYKDPLEASLSAAPILSLQQRDHLWASIMEQILSDDPIKFITGWFFDEELEDITRYDVYDFIAWSMFEGRNQEHLVQEEVKQLQTFLEEVEWAISIHIFGVKEVVANPEHPNYNGESYDGHLGFVRDSMTNMKAHNGNDNAMIRHRAGARSSTSSSINADSIEYRMMTLFDSSDHSDSSSSNETIAATASSTKSNLWNIDPSKRPKPKRNFHFVDTTHDQTPGFFTTLYENYKKNHEQHRHRLEQLENLHPVQDLRDFVLHKTQQLHEAEAVEHAKAAASNAYHTFIDRGSAFDKRLHAMQNQLNEGWNSVGKMKERLETASIVTSRKRTLQQQLRGYKMLLERTIYTDGVSVPTKQMVDLMKKITQCNEALETIEHSASNAFIKGIGLDVSHLLQRKEPQRYAKYSEDPLLGLATYPLIFNLAIFGLTDTLLRVLMSNRGFERLYIGSTVYYYHRGTAMDGLEEDESLTPIVFFHGIGIGLGYYLSLIDELLKQGHPLFLPEIPSVCGFRPWQFRKSILTPHGVVSTITAMLATHGSMKATFIGHSYGTSWLSYMCKYAKESISAVLFLDPICFCLHHPCLTKSFVYHRADPGSVSYMVKTDVLINWTIQRSFPWTRIVLFVEDIPQDIPCSIYISENDVLIPTETVLGYLKFKGAHICDYDDATCEHFSKGPINVTILRNQAHGDWALSRDTTMVIADTARILTEQAECGRGNL